MSQGERLRDAVHRVMRAMQMSERTERSYWGWMLRYVNHCGRRHPRSCGADEVRRFLEHLARERRVSASTQNQARAALVFLYEKVLQRPLEAAPPYARRKRGDRVLEVLEPDEMARLFAHMHGTPLLVAKLMYGTGLRLGEAVSLRLKDLNVSRAVVMVRDGKGGKDRMSVLPTALIPEIRRQFAHVQRLHRLDIARGHLGNWLPDALDRKYPGARVDWRWGWLFPSDRYVRQRERGAHFRWHVHETTMQRAVADAARASGINRRVTPHLFRHTFATQLLRSGYDIRTVQQLLGHRDVQTTMLYLHHMKGGLGVRSPYDLLMADGGRSSDLADTSADVAGRLPPKPET